MTESPLRNILLMKRSLLTGCDFLPPPDLGICREQRRQYKVSSERCQCASVNQCIVVQRVGCVLRAAKPTISKLLTDLGPEFLYIFQNHVAMSIKSLDTS
jgi:hypothetical protein